MAEVKKRSVGKIVLSIVLAVVLIIIAIIFIPPLIPKKKSAPKMTKIDDFTYNFMEGSTNTCMYLLIGDDKAMLIDTGFGFSLLEDAVKKLTNLPVFVVNTHGHYDHVGNNYKYESEVYMNKNDFDLYKHYTTPEAIKAVYDEVPGIFRYFMRQEIKMACDTHYVPAKALPEEGYFELGNRKISFFDIPGHTPGSIALYDEKYNRLFVGDSGAASGLLLNLPLSLSPESYMESAVKMNAFIGEHGITKIYPGHAPLDVTPELIKNYEKGCRDLVEGKVDEKTMKSGSYTVNGATISFYPDIIKKTDEGKKTIRNNLWNI